MKDRVLSSIVIISLVILFMAAGGFYFKASAIFVAILALKELLDIKKITSFLQKISYVILTFTLVYYCYFNSFDLRILVALLIIFFTFIIYYHNNDKYNIEDAFYILGCILLLNIIFSLIIMLENKNISYLIYLIILVATTDTAAYLTGSLIGKNKFIKEISPKKTIEGLVGGLLISVVISVVFYSQIINDRKIVEIIIMSSFLSLLGQFGDLVFSSIKRYYNVKDFSNLIPGHGGIIDRIDSLIFVLLGFVLFL